MNIRRRSFQFAGAAAALLSFSSPALASAPGGQYTIDSANGTVLDNRTGLMWERDAAQPYDWLQALAHCEAMSLAGYVDWRLPTHKELLTIVDVASATTPAIDTAAFPFTPGSRFWTSSPYPDAPDHAWSVTFYDGYADQVPMTESHYVRCVR